VTTPSGGSTHFGAGLRLWIILIVVAVQLSLQSCGRSMELPRESWPQPMTAMVEALGVSPDRVRAASWQDFVNWEYAWRLDCSAEQRRSLVERFEVSPLAPGDVPQRFYDRFPTEWRPAKGTVGAAYFSTPGFPVDRTLPGGGYLMLMHDPAAKLLYVWYKQNFG
jgi:hypothetical protein